ncbi:hypothetical protein Ccar_13375 [Clostridium carboxidivorans P7]|uniref:Uncharacterized protein n=1 Tax=Clostridium carboxidivorans P7 TaxID=536227 RepID=C6PTI0_9CLOT|nr:hypothetical protein [Clostridium carboxidivorans]AKN31801.1 hypothetical protein Ccar_13375 [Clostridium carboxidivorans P7]EET87410.1 hypothetical protein CcarbDRAFT_2097 [Clostridium carboxidivorans P7]EFG87365.1 hypothetical protein CLCAR_2889 [Clostridium carboxidivorans P7]
MKANEILEKVYKTVDKIIKERFKSLSFNRCIEGRIIKRNNDGTYQVNINDKESRVQEKKEVYYKNGDLVDILIRNGNYSDKYILWKK